MVDVIAGLLIVLAFPSWFAAYKLWRLSNLDRSIKALRERLIIQVVLSIAATIVASLAVIRFAPALRIDNGAAVFLLSIAVLLIDVPGLVWLYRNRTPRKKR